MTPDMLIPLASSFLLFLGSTGLWQYVQSRRTTPVQQQEAGLAVAAKSQQMALDVAERLALDYTNLRAELTTAQTNITTLGAQVKSLEEHTRVQDKTIGVLRSSVRAFSAAWDDLVQNWDHYRQSSTPPARPEHALDSDSDPDPERNS